MSMQALAVRTPAFRDRVPAPPRYEATGLTGLSMTFARNEELFGEGEPAEYLYRVTRGCIRGYRILADGRRQITAFYFPGDVCGFETDTNHFYSAEATVDSVVTLVKRRPIEQRARSEASAARQLFDIATAELRRAQEHMLLLVKNAQARLAGFLIDLAARQCTGNEVDLPMSRQEIADHLGLTIETVSRTFTHLENAEVIEIASSRHIVLRDLRALVQLND